jgi:hypothetical protein
MKHNLIIYDMKFVEKCNLNSIIDVLIHGYGFKCLYLKNVFTMLTSAPWSLFLKIVFKNYVLFI